MSATRHALMWPNSQEFGTHGAVENPDSCELGD